MMKKILEDVHLLHLLIKKMENFIYLTSVGE